jgi:murein DD-endopeptidase MepM/ murein hydrolase activator NlpD
MFSLLKRLFSFHRGVHATVKVRDEGSDTPTSSHLNRLALWLLGTGLLIGIIIIIILLLKFTPLQNLIFNHQKMRNSVLAIQHKVSLLEDTVAARNKQLNDMKKILLAGKDTMITVHQGSNGKTLSEPYSKKEFPVDKRPSRTPTMQLPSNAKLVENLFEESPDFPAPYPVEGTLTRRFNINTGHYGIDIATNGGASFKAIADGVIISEEWTFNYGYVIIIQHARGIVTVFKHAKTLRKGTGRIVRAGDILGTIGNVGILSSGPHLHIEIWKNGIPQDAQQYLLGSSLHE